MTQPKDGEGTEALLPCPIESSANASRAATRDHSLAAPEAEPPALVRQFFNERIDRYRQALRVKPRDNK